MNHCSLNTRVHLLITGMLLCLALAGFHPTAAIAGELNRVPGGARMQLSLPDLSSRQRDLGEFEGKVLLVNFWASWCVPCIDEMPSIQRLADAMNGHPFAVISINVGEGKKRVQATVNRLDVDFTVLLDSDSAVFDRWQANILPTNYIIDRSGHLQYIGRGSMEWDRADIIELMKALAQQPGE